MLPNIKQGRLQAIFFMTIYILLFHSFQYITPLNSGDHRTTVPSCIRDKGFSCNIYKRFSTFMAHIFQISCRHFRCLRTLSVKHPDLHHTSIRYQKYFVYVGRESRWKIMRWGSLCIYSKMDGVLNHPLLHIFTVGLQILTLLNLKYTYHYFGFSIFYIPCVIL